VPSQITMCLLKLCAPSYYLFPNSDYHVSSQNTSVPPQIIT